VGAANPWREQIARRCRDTPGFHFHCQVSNMAELMLGADLCIGAGGSSSWERCSVGLPSLVLAVADNQVEVARALDAHGCLRYLGPADTVSAPALADAVAALLADPPALRAMAECGAALVDAQGAARVARALECAPVRLRRAGLADADQLLAWRNAPAVRAASFDPQPITAAAHRRWLHALLADPGRHLLVAEQGAEPVAVLRYDVAGTEATVSIYLLPDCAGRSLGSAILLEGTRWLRAAQPGLVQVRARILAGNAASRAAFRKAGYLASGADYLLTLGDSLAPLTRIP
jgi:RimJ/RimL family protein N-acetyltransferase